MSCPSRQPFLLKLYISRVLSGIEFKEGWEGVALFIVFSILTFY